MLAAGPQTTLEAVWARRPEAAQELADNHGSSVAGSTDELFDRCEAVAFCVPPAVQAELGVVAANAGCAVLLEKPIGGDMAGAEALADAVNSAGVASQVVLTWRYSEPVRAFLAAAQDFAAIGGAGRFVGGGLLAGPFMTPWRLERGPLLDLGPHVIDLLDAALGPVVGVRASGDLASWVSLRLEHESGVVSDANLSAHVGGGVMRSGAELYGSEGVLEIDCAANGFPELATITGEFAEAVRFTAGGGTSGEEVAPHRLDVNRGLHLQRIIADAESQLS
jgi:predicted dehydrogenase